MEAVKTIPPELMTVYALASLKNRLSISVEYVREPDNSISCWTNNGIETWGSGRDYFSAREDLIKAVKEYAVFYLEDFQEWITHNPKEFPYVLKVLMSSDEELRLWLAGQDCENI